VDFLRGEDLRKADDLVDQAKTIKKQIENQSSPQVQP